MSAHPLSTQKQCYCTYSDIGDIALPNRKFLFPYDHNHHSNINININRDLSYNAIEQLGPDSLPHLPNLKTLLLNNNRLVWLMYIYDIHVDLER